MYTIIEHIEYLLTSHDCVVIPGWGALVAQYGESHYNPASGMIERPRRELGFNASVSHNDGLLAQSLVRREGISYDEAMRFVTQSVSAFGQQLSQVGEVPLGRLGYFHSADGKHIEFTPFSHVQSNDGYFGLVDVKLRPLAESKARAEAQAAAAALTAATSRRGAWSRAIQVAASVLVLLCLTVVLTTPVIVNRNHHQDYATLNLPTVTKPQRQVLDVPQPESAAATQPEVAEPAPAPASQLLLDEGGSSLLVVASFGTEQQAEAYKQMHPDLADKMQVLRMSSNVCYVYVARSSNQSHLYSLRSSLPSGYEDSWVKP